MSKLKIIMDNEIDNLDNIDNNIDNINIIDDKINN